MQQHGLAHDVVTCRALFSACGNRKQPEDACEALQPGSSMGLRQNEIICKDLISACERGKQPGRVWAAWTYIMCDRPQCSDQRLRRGEQPVHAWDVTHAMQQQGLMISMIISNALISAEPQVDMADSSEAWRIIMAP